ncbi:tRNA lysidine(34) synthetase TilS [Amorphus orientalis]|uniref:tRNA(Ile)-lysidine synthase n=1 Tax=Amorphus orientalis TaxID=649198 RepID=A0AAE3VL84_9HYPH|nr:tRNA lysidine(34) synthetase TilS [Amorphus orientalis]MDQ0313968.1 tRNA(Ile)-lysidine synthase [Amorphus orientalis]
MPAAPEPVSVDETARVFAGLTPHERIVLAVSGGSDSMALMALYGRHRSITPEAPDAVVVTVDHDLRAGSAEDAGFVVDAAERLGFSAIVRRWTGDKPGSDIQAAAREARYRILREAASEQGATAILTAHTRDDQAETFLMRLARGSGLKGLSAMPATRDLGGVELVRPLLGVGRDRLRATLHEAGIGFRDDPSNGNTRFARVRMRALMPALASEGLDAKRLADTAARLARADRAVDAMVERLAATHVEVHEGGFLSCPVAVLTEAEEEVRLRLLVAALGWVGGGVYGPRLEAAERAMARIIGDPVARMTLAGTRLVRRRDRVFVFREAGRAGLPRDHVAPGGSLVWDGRFRIALAPDAPDAVTVAPVGTAWRKLGGRGYDGRVPAAALAAVPAVYAGGDEAVAVPAFGHFADPRWAGSIATGFASPPPGRRL